MKPGGTAGGINPIAWGTYSPGYAKMAGKYPGLTLQPADCMGAVFADKWLGTAYAYYGVRLSTEPAGGLDRNSFVQRMFSDASCGASQFFTYEFEQHAADMRKYIRLYTGRSGDKRIALFCPTTLYRLGGDLAPTISAAEKMRDLCDFDVLDELLIADGALKRSRYDVLIFAQGAIVEPSILQKFDDFVASGGKIVVVGKGRIRDVDDQDWATGRTLARTTAVGDKSRSWLSDLAKMLEGVAGCDGKTDGLWMTRRGRQVMIYNPADKAIDTTVDGRAMSVEGHSIWTNE